MTSFKIFFTAVRPWQKEVFGFIFDVGVQVEAQIPAFVNNLNSQYWRIQMKHAVINICFLHTHYSKAAVERFRFELTFACPLPPFVFQEKDSRRNRNLFMVPDGSVCVYVFVTWSVKMVQPNW